MRGANGPEASPSCVSVPGVRQTRQKNESVNQESVVVKYSVQIIIDTHCIHTFI